MPTEVRGQEIAAPLSAGLGGLADPTALVNRLSVLAPGMIRELFSGIFEGITARPDVHKNLN